MTKSAFDVSIFVTSTEQHVLWDHTGGDGAVSSGILFDLTTVPFVLEDLISDLHPQAQDDSRLICT